MAEFQLCGWYYKLYKKRNDNFSDLNSECNAFYQNFMLHFENIFILRKKWAIKKRETSEKYTKYSVKRANLIHTSCSYIDSVQKFEKETKKKFTDKRINSTALNVSKKYG